MLVRTVVLILLCSSYSTADDVELEVRSSQIFKMLRDMSNKTSADSLNLPANASSIRENITDTFSCENRTYGYYADVDNDCQIFHVCLPSQTPSGRNVTYRWSFICPNETIFNQEVLVCTRPIDSIPCEESPMYYDVNNEFGKVPNNTKKHDTNEETDTNKIYTNKEGGKNKQNYRPNERFTNRDTNRHTVTKPNSEKDSIRHIMSDSKKIENNQQTNSIEKDTKPTNSRPNVEKETNKHINRPTKRRPDIQKQNLMSETDMELIVNQEMSDKVEDFGADIENVENIFPIVEPSENESYAIENKDKIIIDDDARLIMERNLGSSNFFRFLSDV